MGPQNAGPELRAALIAVLESETRAHLEAYKADRSGQMPEFVESPELIGRVIRAVAQLEDPKTIPALAGALGTGFTAIRALVGFGQQAAPAVLDVVRSPNSTHYQVDAGLIALRLMVERTPSRPLSSDTLDQIGRVAQERLTGNQYFTTLWWAIDLAVVLNDVELRRIVESLASDWNEVVARGVDDPDLIERTQKRASDRLAGIAPLPRR